MPTSQSAHGGPDTASPEYASLFTSTSTAYPKTRPAATRKRPCRCWQHANTIIPGGVQGLDRYAYVNNSPINYTDPSGHMCMDDNDKPTPCQSESNSNNTGQVADLIMRWNGSSYSGSQMRDLYNYYNNIGGWWNSGKPGTFTVKDFLTLILFFELNSLHDNDPNTISLLTKAAVEKFTYWCAEASGGYCSGASDQSVFNYIATRGSAWIRYDAYIRPNPDIIIPGYTNRPNPKDDPKSNSNYQMVSGITDAIYGAQGTGSLWDWGNQAGGQLDMLKSGIVDAPVDPNDPTGVTYISSDGYFYILNADQANFWAK